MTPIILTVQSCGLASYRLGINVKCSREVFKCRKVPVRIHIKGYVAIECKTACGNPCDKSDKWLIKDKPVRKKGYDLNSKKLSKWISESGYVSVKKGKPKKLEFSLWEENSVIHLSFVSEVLN